ncbi:SLC13 family permease [Lactiplantibacillus plajomi]|uniref:SLC13 family permease n=1 Tax=Lactiplantibacillus plajomi TaxID=1457217 RepID=A0ABV6JZT4_9LACO|nr:SLC13 family permease [Lactiplantibacillus plajomi]
MIDWYAVVITLGMLAIIMYLLLANKAGVMICFAVIPVIAAFLLGKNVTQVGNYVSKGLQTTIPVALITLFIVLLFDVMSDAGLFNILVGWLVKRTHITPVSVTILNIIVCLIAGLSAGTTSVIVITIPLMLPFYQKFKMSRMYLLFLTSVGTVFAYVWPWSDKMLRSASLIPKVNNAPAQLFMKLLPVDAIFLVLTIVLAYLIGIKEKNRLIKEEGADFIEKISKSFEEESRPSVIQDKNKEDLARPKLFIFNLIWILLSVVSMIVLPSFPSYYLFAVGLVVALAVNYPDLKLQKKILKKHASGLLPVVPTILLSGVLVGVMEYSGMMNQVLKAFIQIIPSQIGPWIYIILALLAIPLMLMFTNDTWYYVLIPLVMGLMAKYGIDNMIVIATLFMNMGALVDPKRPQVYLAMDLAGGEYNISQFYRLMFLPMTACQIVWVLLGVVLGAFR